MTEGTGGAAEQVAVDITLSTGDTERARLIEALAQAGPEASPTPVSFPPAPPFDPSLFAAAAIPEATDENMLTGVKTHLQRYGNLQSIPSALERIERAGWLEVWDTALAGMRNRSVCFHGSELGILPLAALAHGAREVSVFEPRPAAARLASGVLQKNRLRQWHSAFSAQTETLSAEERQASFASFNAPIRLLEDQSTAVADCFVFPAIDHTLLGTGIVEAVFAFRAIPGNEAADILPGRARVFVQAIRWKYPPSVEGMAVLSQFRWSPYPQAWTMQPEAWEPVTAPVHAGDIDLARFESAVWRFDPPALSGGSVDGFLVWYELHAGEAVFASGPNAVSPWALPAFHYADAFEVSDGVAVACTITVEPTRLRVEAERKRVSLRTAQLPSWYMPMLLDERRNQAYAAALSAAMAGREDMTVLDIGAGCGMLSLLAARAGAAHVYGCEIHPAIHAAGEAIVAANGMSDRISLIARDCRRMTVPGDMRRRADLAVFELFDCSLLGEGVLHYLAHARETLLAPDAVYVPAGARLRAMLVEYRLDERLGVDVNLVNPYRFSPSFVNVDAATLDYKPLTDPFDVFSFDFATATPDPAAVRVDVAATAPGTAGAILFWIELMMDGDTTLSSAPGALPLHWKQGLQLLPEVALNIGDMCPVDASHDGSAVAFRWRPDTLPAERFSRLPRLDPQHWRQASALEAQTGELLQHCAAHPAEFEKVAHLSATIAVDPAAQSVDAVVAQRFFSLFRGR